MQVMDCSNLIDQCSLAAPFMDQNLILGKQERYPPNNFVMTEIKWHERNQKSCRIKHDHFINNDVYPLLEKLSCRGLQHDRKNQDEKKKQLKSKAQDQGKINKYRGNKCKAVKF